MTQSQSTNVRRQSLSPNYLIILRLKRRKKKKKICVRMITVFHNKILRNIFVYTDNVFILPTISAIMKITQSALAISNFFRAFLSISSFLSLWQWSSRDTKNHHEKRIHCQRHLFKKKKGSYLNSQTRQMSIRATWLIQKLCFNIIQYNGVET